MTTANNTATADFIATTTDENITYTAATDAGREFLDARRITKMNFTGEYAVTMSKDAAPVFCVSFMAAGLTCELAESEYTEHGVGYGPGEPVDEIDAYERRVRAYEAEGMSRSDAQAVVDAEDMQASKPAEANPLADPAVTLPFGDGFEAVEERVTAIAEHTFCGTITDADLRALAATIRNLRTELDSARKEVIQLTDELDGVNDAWRKVQRELDEHREISGK